MKEYEDPQQHLEQHMERAAERYVQGLQHAGLTANETLNQAVAERAYEKAKENYEQHAIETLTQNTTYIIQEHNNTINNIKRKGTQQALIICPPIAIVYGILAWYSLSHSGNLFLSLIYLFAAFAFIGILMVKIFFDKPQKPSIALKKQIHAQE